VTSMTARVGEGGGGGGVALVVGVKEEANVGWAGGGGSRDEVTDLVRVSYCSRILYILYEYVALYSIYIYVHCTSVIHLCIEHIYCQNRHTVFDVHLCTLQSSD
jgi:hypothetical protein